MALQIFPSTGGIAGSDGVFIPVSDLVAGGIASDAEFDDSEDADLKLAKAMYALALVLTTEISSLNALDRTGVTATPPNINNQAHAFTLTTQRYVRDDFDTRPLPVPVPSAGDYNGRGDFTVLDIFPNAAKTANGATISEAGVLIWYGDIYIYGMPVFSAFATNADARLFFHCLMRDFALNTTDYPNRSLSVASAITARSGGTSTELTIPAAYTAGTNPTSGLDPAQLPTTHVLSSGNVTITLDTLKSIVGGEQTWEVNVATL